MSEQKENDYFSDGITEEIINTLSNIDGLQVTSRMSSFYFRDKQIDIKEVGERLNVSVVLEGSVRRSGSNVRITVHLVNVADRLQYWSETYNHQLDDIFSVQDEISDKVAQKMREHVGHFNIIEKSYFSQKEDIDAYELYLHSKYNFNQFNQEGIQLAARQIEEVLTHIQDSAKYCATKSVYYAYLGLFNVMPMTEALEISYTSATQALKIDPTDPEANYAKAVADFIFGGDLDNALYHIQKALHYRPNFPLALSAYAFVNVAIGNHEQALDAAQKSIKLDPISASARYYYAVILMRLGIFHKALEAVEACLEQVPNNVNFYQLKGVILTRLGRYDEARSLYMNVPDAQGNTGSYYPGLGIVYAHMGNKEKALECLSRVPEDLPNAYFGYAENPHVIIPTLLGDLDTAFKHIEKDIEKKKFYLKFYKVLPAFELLKQDKRYHLLERVFYTKGALAQPKKEKYLKSGIGKREVSAINTKLIRLMETKKPYLNGNLTLNMLAQTLNESANHVSQVINDQHKKNFFAFTNEYRIQEMEQLLKDPENKKLTLLALAHKAGFNSKTAFNMAFKNLKDATPSQFFKTRNLI
ncbi:MAG: tetratricopeptide repeat protein [Flavobacteriales bacterium]|nr:tetratricopeptide repeat protein [Flavobacteriales bacterium]